MENIYASRSKLTSKYSFSLSGVRCVSFFFLFLLLGVRISLFLLSSTNVVFFFKFSQNFPLLKSYPINYATRLKLNLKRLLPTSSINPSAIFKDVRPFLPDLVS